MDAAPGGPVAGKSQVKSMLILISVVVHTREANVRPCRRSAINDRMTGGKMTLDGIKSKSGSESGDRHRAYVEAHA